MSLDRTNLDDPSAHYGLGHGAADGAPIDGKGRKIVALPDQSLDTDPELVGKSPDDILAILARREQEREDNPDIDRLMREVPGGRVEGGGSGGGRKRERPRRAGGNTNVAMAHVYEDEIGRDVRPNVVSGRVSNDAYAGLNGGDAPNVGEILELIGQALKRGTPWKHLADTIAML